MALKISDFYSQFEFRHNSKNPNCIYRFETFYNSKIDSQLGTIYLKDKELANVERKGNFIKIWLPVMDIYLEKTLKLSDYTKITE